MVESFGGIGGTTYGANLRPVTLAIDREMARRARVATATSLSELRRACGELVERLALRPGPEVRECPTYSHREMRAATRCGFGWTTLPLLDHFVDEGAAIRSPGGGCNDPS